MSKSRWFLFPFVCIIKPYLFLNHFLFTFFPPHHPHYECKPASSSTYVTHSLVQNIHTQWIFFPLWCVLLYPPPFKPIQLNLGAKPQGQGTARMQPPGHGLSCEFSQTPSSGIHTAEMALWHILERRWRSDSSRPNQTKCLSDSTLYKPPAQNSE